MLPYGRMQESEADEIGIYLMHKAGYNVNEATKFWENMSEGKSGGNDFSLRIQVHKIEQKIFKL